VGKQVGAGPAGEDDHDEPDGSAEAGEDDGDGEQGDGDDGDEGPDRGLDSCAGIEATADARLLPIDIVWAIDGSGSTTSAFPAIQRALSKFSQDVNAAGLDAHIVLLTSQGLRGLDLRPGRRAHQDPALSEGV
jgi:hypothetical protein